MLNILSSRVGDPRYSSLLRYNYFDLKNTGTSGDACANSIFNTVERVADPLNVRALPVRKGNYVCNVKIFDVITDDSPV